MKNNKPLKISFVIVFLLFVTSLFAQTTVVTTPITSAQADNGDDAEERISDGTMDLTSSDLEFYNDADDSNLAQYVGIRFQNVNVPNGAAILNAYIQFDVDESESGDVTIKIEGIDVDDAAQFTGSDFNISRRIDGTISSGTAATENWSPPNWTNVGENGADQQTSDISSIVQEIVNRPGWTANNDMAFVFSGVSGSPSRRTAEDGDNGSHVLELIIEYATGPPEIDITSNAVSITDGDTTPDVSDNTQYGNVSVGQTKDVVFSAKNIGTGTITVSGAALTGDAEFTAVSPPSPPIVLNAGESVDITVRFTPTGANTSSTQVTILSDDSDEGTYTFMIEGTGVTPDVEIDIEDTFANAIDDGGGNSPSLFNSTDFGSTDVSNPITKTYRVKNTGTTDLSVSSVISSDSDFAISAAPSAVVGGGSFTTFQVTFTPSSTGTISSTITVNNDDTDENPYTFTVEGIGYNSQSFIAANDSWNYYDNSQEPPNDGQGDEWMELDFNDGSWSSDNAPLGYGDMNGIALNNIDNATEVAYFRKTFNVTDHTLFNSLNLQAVRDDGMVVYINGTEVWRDNMDGEIGDNVTYGMWANSVVGGSGEGAWLSTSIANSLVTGTNIVAVEVHQENSGSSDISFNFSLEASGAPFLETVARGPYLQSLTPTSVIVRWRTDTATDTQVNYGTTLGSLSGTVSDGTSTTEHEIQIIGLTPNTKYYYEIEDAGGVYVPQSNDMFVVTAPPPSTDQFVRAWILGDAGTANQDQRNVRDAYYNYVNNASTHPSQTDMMLFLGDNAYNSGTDSEYQSAFYDIYHEMLKRAVAWSTLGNHDGYSAGSSTNPGVQSGPYYDMFTFPTAGEAGGLASGTEAYYSFDYANIHFIVLESYHLENDATQLTWLANDLAATTQDWIVAFFHHPPYTKGSHDSDSEGDLIDVRANFLPILEAGGVDLVLNGHSHSYERTYFINGHYGLSGSFDGGSGGTNIVGANGHLSGKADTADGAYTKAADPEGAVYITTGSAGKVTGTLTLHDAMYSSLYELGSCVMEVENDGSGGQNLTVKFVRETGAIDDYFTINKSGITVVLNNETQELDDQISVYPVPTNSLLNIKVMNGEQLQTIQFYNIVGSMVKETAKEQINVSGLKAGMYMLKIKTDKEIYYRSVIVE